MKGNMIKEKVRRYYNEKVAQYPEEILALKEIMMEPLYEKILKFAEIDKRSTVGIIGSSTGSMPLFMAPYTKRVIGIDFSEESLSFARERTKELGIKNIEYKKGDAEALPLKDESVDVVLSDCVINLVPDKVKAFKEIHRILKTGGNVVIADPIREKPLQKTSDELLTGCIAGTVTEGDYRNMLREAGFDNVEITDITDLARSVFAQHEEKFDKYGLTYVIIKASKKERLNKTNDDIKKTVRQHYSQIAKQSNTGCISQKTCCGSSNIENLSRKIGYNKEDLHSVPEGANLGLGCGNPVALTNLKEGDIVLDLGSGAGFDSFLAANKVGKKGRVIGVDMTPEMIEKARENIRKGNYENVEFRLGEIEYLPVADNSVDVVISNCVINLSTDKERVFKEAYRVLKPGGRLMISDIVLLKELPDFIKNSIEAYIGCISGAVMKDEYIETIKAAGFQGVKIIGETSFPIEYRANDPIAKAITENLKIPTKKLNEIANSVLSIKIYGIKPHKTT